MGRKATPLKLLKARGSWKAKGRVEPPAPEGKPTLPGYLSPGERRIYRQVVGHLSKMGILAKVDGAQLGRYAVLMQRWHEVRTIVQEQGESYTTPGAGGSLEYHTRPEARMFLAYHAELARIEASFGLTPSARASIGMQTSIGKAAERGDTHEQGKARFFA